MFCLKKKTRLKQQQKQQQQQRSHLTAKGSRMEKHLNSKKKRNKQTKTNTFKILPHYLKDVGQEI